VHCVRSVGRGEALNNARIPRVVVTVRPPPARSSGPGADLHRSAMIRSVMSPIALALTGTGLVLLGWYVIVASYAFWTRPRGLPAHIRSRYRTARGGEPAGDPVRVDPGRGRRHAARPRGAPHRGAVPARGRPG